MVCMLTEISLDSYSCPNPLGNFSCRDKMLYLTVLLSHLRRPQSPKGGQDNWRHCLSLVFDCHLMFIFTLSALCL